MLRMLLSFQHQDGGELLVIENREELPEATMIANLFDDSRLLSLGDQTKLNGRDYIVSGITLKIYNDGVAKSENVDGKVFIRVKDLG